MLELSLLVGNAFNRKLSPYEETEQAARLKAALIRARNEDNLVIQGRMRDLIAEMMQTSPSEVARMNKINSSLVPEAKEQFRAGNLSKSAAYETAKLPEEEQKEIAACAAEGREVKHKDIAERVQEKKQQQTAEEAAKRAEKAAKRAEEAQIAAAQAGVQAERAAENADLSAGKFGENAMNPPESDEKGSWSTRDWVIYTLRELLMVASHVTEDELLVLQDMLMTATERSRDGTGGV